MCLIVCRRCVSVWRRGRRGGVYRGSCGVRAIGVWRWSGLEWKFGVWVCWRRDLMRSMVWGVKVMSIRGRIVWASCGWLEDWGLVEGGGSGWAGRNGGGVEYGVCYIGKGCVGGGGVGCGGVVVICSLVVGVTCEVRFSLDMCRFLCHGEYEEGVACCDCSPSTNC